MDGGPAVLSTGNYVGRPILPEFLEVLMLAPCQFWRDARSKRRGQPWGLGEGLLLPTALASLDWAVTFLAVGGAFHPNPRLFRSVLP